MGETRIRLHAAADWLLRAQEANPDGGVSLGYFPCDARGGWWPSYPETTGYIVTSLLEYATHYQTEEIRERALRMARWEVEIQMGSGGVQGGPVCPPEERSACAFNTGMVLEGWVSAYRVSGDRQFFDAARRAAEFLLGDLHESGYFRTNGEFVTPGEIKTYNVLCAWSLCRFGDQAQDLRYRDAAIRVVEAALRQQSEKGWIANNCLTRPEAPLVHTIGYTLQGILEVGILAGRRDFVEAARRGLHPVLSRVSPAGFLAGRFYRDWVPAAFSSCLTGSAQIAVTCYRMFEHTGQPEYLAAAERIVNYLKALQSLDAPDPSVRGALGGSFPLFGNYMSCGYPNWATKYLLDALMCQDRMGGG